MLMTGEQFFAMLGRGGFVYAEKGIEVIVMERCVYPGEVKVEGPEAYGNIWLKGRAWDIGRNSGGLELTLLGRGGSGWYPMQNVFVNYQGQEITRP